MWCGDHTDMGVCTFPAEDMHTRNVSTVLTHHKCTDVKAVSVLCAVCALHVLPIPLHDRLWYQTLLRQHLLNVTGLPYASPSCAIMADHRIMHHHMCGVIHASITSFPQ